MSDDAPLIRRYQPADHDRLREICIGTGHGGSDARGHFADPEVLPAVFASPYAAYDPELVFVADEGRGAFGYVLGTTGSTAFFRWVREQWLPTVADRFPEPEGTPETPDDRVRSLLHHPERMLVPSFEAEYPAHLHIDLLPEGQGRGLGRRLMETYLAELRRRGVPGVHLGVNRDNTRAVAFYDRMGFTDITTPETPSAALHLGLRL